MDINELKELERTYQDKLNEVKDDIIKAINDVKYPESKVIGKNIVLVSLTELNDNWLPSYHIPGKESEKIVKKIQKATSVSNLHNIIKNLIKEKKIDKEVLNHNIVKKLEEINDMF